MKKFGKQVLELARVDSRACASRPHQVLKRSLALWIKIWTKSRRRRRLQVKTSRSRLVSRFIFFIRFCF